MKRLRPPAARGDVHQLPPPQRALVTLTLAEQQEIARRRARVDLPTKQRDLSEVWGPERQKRKPGGKHAAR